MACRVPKIKSLSKLFCFAFPGFLGLLPVGESSPMSWDVPRSWTTIRNCCSHRLITCEQALLFGQGKRTAGERASERRSREGPRLLSRASCASIFPDFAQMESLLAGYWLKEGLTVRNTGKANVPSPSSNKFTFPGSLRGKRAFSTNLSWVKRKYPYK